MKKRGLTYADRILARGGTNALREEVDRFHTMFGKELTADIDELLALLVEECAEVVRVVQKIRRFGVTNERYDNEAELAKELGHVYLAVDLLERSGFLDKADVIKSAEKKELNMLNSGVLKSSAYLLEEPEETND